MKLNSKSAPRSLRRGYPVPGRASHRPARRGECRDSKCMAGNACKAERLQGRRDSCKA